jgi:hypothetical protein
MSEWWQITLAIIGGALVLINFYNAIMNLVKNAKSPTDSLEMRIEEIEKKISVYEERFGRDKARLDSFDEGNRVILKSLLAIMKHDIDGNNVEELKVTSKELQEYMLKR